ncbi:MAG TPA: peptidoglycan DD-metalloendopeptidase family protein [Gaiellaceae bacterium]|nr:peptidoglycan DD-metalloendopeptidase family protein [Gaiellaceae bacterium]
MAASRLFAVGLAALVVVAPAAAGTIEHKRSVDERIADLKDRVAVTQAKEAALQAEIDAASSRIRALEQQVGDVSQRLEPLEDELRLRELKLNRLNALYQVQSQQLAFLRAQYQTAVARMNARLVAAYETQPPDTLAVVLSARSFGELLDSFDYIRAIADYDRRVVDEVTSSKRQVAKALARTRAARATVSRQAEVVAVRVHQARVLREELIASQGRLEEARRQKKVSLDSLSASERADASEIDALQAVSASLAAKIQAAQAHSTVRRASSASGFVWPVNAGLTSPFGWRWGRMHEGVDLGAAYGTPILAAAAGTVIYAGWMGGYGNLVVIDHGGGLSTAYGHQSRIAVAVGQAVAQGQVIGYVGSTGHSTGPHLHFEVRVDGQPVDPLGYL